MQPLIRIVLRYLAGALVAKGIFDPDTGAALANDPEVAAYVEMVAGVVIGTATEWWYARAARKGGPT